MAAPSTLDTSVPLWLDHASIEVPELAAAVEHLDRRLGLRATVSPAAPERHSRLLLHRNYLEVSARPGGSGWSASLFLVRFTDLPALRVHLDAGGISYQVSDYTGVDGRWDSVDLDPGPVPLPIITRRTWPPEVARDWPPALASPHRCGAWTLAALYLTVPSLAQALDVYGRLLGRTTHPSPTPDPRWGCPSVELPLAAGRLVLLEGGGAPGIPGIVLGVVSLAATRAALSGVRLSREEEGGVAWIDPAETFGLSLGLMEAGPPG